MTIIDDLAGKCLSTNGRMRFNNQEDSYCSFGIPFLECPFLTKTRCVVINDNEGRNVYWGCDYVPLKDKEYYTTN